MLPLEPVISEGMTLAYVIRCPDLPKQTTFLTPEDAALQLGFVVHPAGGTITPHAHQPIIRTITGTPEVLIVRRGRCEATIYNDAKRAVAICELREGDMLLLLGGGHGFRMLEDTVFLEVKQGPYASEQDKERL